MKYLLPLLLCTCLYADVEQDSVRNQARRWAREAPPAHSEGNSEEEKSWMGIKDVKLESMEDIQKRDANPHKMSNKVSNYDNVKEGLPKKK